MENILLKDNLKKESKFSLGMLIFCIFLNIAEPIVVYFRAQNGTEIRDTILTAVLFFVFVCFFLFFYLAYVKYKLEVNDTQIVITKLFRIRYINISDINSYIYVKANKRFGELYVFKFVINGKETDILTRYYKELDEILKSKNQSS